LEHILLLLGKKWRNQARIRKLAAGLYSSALSMLRNLPELSILDTEWKILPPFVLAAGSTLLPEIAQVEGIAWGQGVPRTIPDEHWRSSPAPLRTEAPGAIPSS
jgi:hypothetical protein